MQNNNNTMKDATLKTNEISVVLNSQSNRFERNEQNRSESTERDWTERQMKKWK